jgi:DNA-binding response OmpR family regulator
MKTILVVDDDPGVLTLIRMIFRSEGWSVDTARNGREALEQLETLPSEPDVIVLDLMMPEVDGRQFYRIARDRGVRSSIIILSAYGSDIARKELGAEDSLAKPFEPEVLVARVEALAAAS